MDTYWPVSEPVVAVRWDGTDAPRLRKLLGDRLIKVSTYLSPGEGRLVAGVDNPQDWWEEPTPTVIPLGCWLAREPTGKVRLYTPEEFTNRFTAHPPRP